MEENKLDPKKYQGFSNIPFEEYAQIDATNQSTAKLIVKETPFAYWWNRKYGRASKKEFDEGRIIHKVLLEPRDFDENFYKVPKSYQDLKELEYFEMLTDKEKESLESAKRITATNAYKKLYKMLEDNKKGQPVKGKLWQELVGMKNALSRHPVVDTIHSKFLTEITVVWYDSEVQEWCKGMIDGLNNNGLIADLKSTRYAGLPYFMYDVKKYGYDFQLAFYINGAMKAMEQNPDSLKNILSENGATQEQIDNFSIKAFLIFAVEKKAPQQLAIYKMRVNGITHREGTKRVEEAFRKIQQCRETGEYKMYTDTDGSDIIDMDKHYRS